MERITIEDMIDVAKIMYDKVTKERKETCFIGFYEDTRELIKELLIVYDETNLYSVDICSSEMDGYDKEYIVSLDEDMNIWVERAYQEDCRRYLLVEDNCILIADDCCSRILDSVEFDEIFEIGYRDEDCCHESDTDDCEVKTRVAFDDGGKIRGFEKSWISNEDGLNYKSTYSFYSSNEKMLKEMMNNFKVKY